jgi:predicted Zn-dependent protease
MKDQTRAELMTKIEAGEVPLRDLAGLSKTDIQALEHVGRVAFESGRFEKAIEIFRGLEALEPDRPEHILRRAYAEVRAGRTGIAISTLNDYLDQEIQYPPEDLARALLLRAQLNLDRDPPKARADVAVAKALSEKFPEIKTVVERLGR